MTACNPLVLKGAILWSSVAVRSFSGENRRVGRIGLQCETVRRRDQMDLVSQSDLQTSAQRFRENDPEAFTHFNQFQTLHASSPVITTL